MSKLVIQRRKQQFVYFIEDKGGLNLDMVQIPTGHFLMGSPGDELKRLDNEGPQHEVAVTGFFMGRYPITQAQWRRVAQMSKLARDLEANPSSFKGDKRPVDNVSWYDAIEFCARLSRHTQRNYRLPSEAEWEYACRANTKTPFHFGETINTDFANYDGNYVYGKGIKGKNQGETTKVDHFRVVNNFGLSDMHGNIWEWCLDPWHGIYKNAPANSGVWDEENNDNHYQKVADNIEVLLGDERTRILRGGSWSFNPRNCRSASRVDFDPDYRGLDFGFRVVCGAARTL
ncbi:MAG: formylglycine-generating enzyme family protein [Spirulinaceae cyanobacterium]